MKVYVYGDSLLKFVLWEKGKYVIHREPVERFSREFNMEIVNRSYFGSCVDKGLERIRADLQKGSKGEYAVIEFGGNDCSFDWKAIDERPEEAHDSAIALPVYLDGMRSCIRSRRGAGVKPIMTNMLPFDPASYLDWVTRSLDRERVLRWLGEENRVYRKNELYCRSLEKLAREEGVPLVDLRAAFLDKPLMRDYYCEDGVHPNRAGHELIYSAFSAFVRSFGSLA